jgi:hypothetical protein
MAETCAICCDTFNKSTRFRVICPNTDCNMTACRTCVRTYLIGSSQDPHCMSCRAEWEQDTVDMALGSGFMKKEYRGHRGDYLIERAKSQIPATQEAVERYVECKRLEEMNAADLRKIIEMEAEIKTMREVILGRIRLVDDIRDRHDSLTTIKEKRSFIMPCPDAGCRGYMSSAYKCAACSKFSCPKCLVVLGENKDVAHECDQDTVKTVEQIKRETKPCPKCGERISKVSGCDQMWCTAQGCGTAFSWRTGKIESGTIHNPHYFQWARANAVNGVIPRQPGDVVPNQCGNPNRPISVDAIKLLRTANRSISKNKTSFDIKAIETWVTNGIQNANHVRIVEIPRLREQIRNHENTELLRVKYIVKEITEAELKTALIDRDTRRKKALANLNIMELFTGTFPEIVYRISHSINNKQKPEEILAILRGILFEAITFNEYCNDLLMKYSALYNTTVVMRSVNIADRSFQPPWRHRVRFSKRKVAQILAARTARKDVLLPELPKPVVKTASEVIAQFERGEVVPVIALAPPVSP